MKKKRFGPIVFLMIAAALAAALACSRGAKTGEATSGAPYFTAETSSGAEHSPAPAKAPKATPSPRPSVTPIPIPSFEPTPAPEYLNVDIDAFNALFDGIVEQIGVSDLTRTNTQRSWALPFYKDGKLYLSGHTCDANYNNGCYCVLYDFDTGRVLDCKIAYEPDYR